MATPKSPVDGARRAGRNISHPLVRRTTKGPLDTEEDPSAAKDVALPATTHSPPQRQDGASSALSTIDQSRVPTTDPSIEGGGSTSAVDLGFLQDRRAYHKLPVDDIPQSFLKSDLQPVLGTPLADLLRGGHFRRAADASLNELLHIEPFRSEQILQLLYCRLACLVLIGRHDLAVDEAVPIFDFLGSNASDVEHALRIMPWELRVLVVRLQLFTAQDGGRRGIMAIYSLASEVRAYIRSASNAESRATWQARLNELGLRVADALVEIGEIETACRHLDSLHDGGQNEINARKAILHIQSGNLVAARASLDQINDEHTRAVAEILLASVEKSMEHGLTAWTQLQTDASCAALASQNQALFLLYTGQIVKARQLLEEATKTQPVNSTMLFNLSTIYELCSDKAALRKLQMAEDLAGIKPKQASGGWERSNTELKL